MSATPYLLGAVSLALAPTASLSPSSGTRLSGPSHCAKTLIGTDLTAPAFSEETSRRLEQDVQIARAALAIAPDREESYFWLGRRLGYLGRNCEAIAVFTQGLEKFPDSYRIRRYRGRHLARTRQFDAALTDYQDALRLMGDTPDSFEPDGAPNALGLTLGTYRSNIIYYDAQTRFATGDYRNLVDGMAKALELAPDFARDDLSVAVHYWTYLGRRKMGEHQAAKTGIAAVPTTLKLIENDNYHEGVKVMQGAIDKAVAAQSQDSIVKFAAAMEYRFAGDERTARQLLREIVLDNGQGYWPAEVELVSPDR